HELSFYRLWSELPAPRHTQAGRPDPDDDIGCGVLEDPLDRGSVPREVHGGVPRLYEIHRDGAVPGTQHTWRNLDHVREERLVPVRWQMPLIRPGTAGTRTWRARPSAPPSSPTSLHRVQHRPRRPLHRSPRRRL